MKRRILALTAWLLTGFAWSAAAQTWTEWRDPEVNAVNRLPMRSSFEAGERLSLDGVPVGIRIDEVEKTMEAVPGVKAVHHIHVWAISTTENALTALVVWAELPRMEPVKRQLNAELETAGIHHVTLEFESSAEHCPGTCD